MATLVPAILTRDPQEVREKIRFLETIPEVTDVQIDFEDGEFVPVRSVLPRDLFGLQTRLRIEAHLMTVHPERHLHDLEVLRARLVYLHFESFSTVSELLTAVGNAKTMGFQCGVAINPGTEVSVVDGLVSEIDGVLLMSVHPGYQGLTFLSESLERLETLRKAHRNVIIEMDGGINMENFGTLVAHGVDRLVVGSGIWQTPDPKQTIQYFLRRLK